METLGTRIRKVRQEMKLTQAKVAKASGVSAASVTQWEQDANQPRGESLLALARALHCDPGWLLTGQYSLKDKKDKITTNEHYQNPFISMATTNNVFEDEPVDKLQKINHKSALQPISAPGYGKAESNSNQVELEYYDVEVHAGHSELVANKNKTDQITFNRNFIDTVIGVNPKNIFLMPVHGDSMAPTLKNQALVMVNRVKEFTGDGIYVFHFLDQLMVKRLQFSKTGLIVISDSPTYKEWELNRNELNDDNFTIIGEVVWSGQKM